MFELNFISGATFFVAFLVLNLTIIIHLGGKNLASRSFVKLLLVVTLWIVSCGFLYGAQTNELAFFAWHTGYFFGMLTAIYFYIFSRTFPDNINLSRREWKLFISFQIILFVVYFARYFPFVYNVLISKDTLLPRGPIIEQTFAIEGLQMWGLVLSDTWFFVFDGPFIMLWTLGLYTLYKKYKHQKENLKKRQLKYMFWAIFIGVALPLLANIILPHFDIFQPHPYGLFSNIFWASIVSYSIMKYNQMNIRTVFTEILVLVAILLLFINIFI